MDNPHYVTPEEAKEKVCPQSMGGLLMVQNTVMASEHGCLGTDCMAWRWKEDFIFLDRYTTTGTLEITGSKYVYNYSTTHGYCGIMRS